MKGHEVLVKRKDCQGASFQYVIGGSKVAQLVGEAMLQRELEFFNGKKEDYEIILKENDFEKCANSWCDELVSKDDGAYCLKCEKIMDDCRYDMEDLE